MCPAPISRPNCPCAGTPTVPSRSPPPRRSCRRPPTSSSTSTSSTSARSTRISNPNSICSSSAASSACTDRCICARRKVSCREVTFHGDASLDDFHTVDGVMGEDLLKWDSVRFNGIDANLNPQTVGIQEIAVDNAYARLVIETNKTINLLNALRLTNTNAPATNEANVAVAQTAVARNRPPPPRRMRMSRHPAPSEWRECAAANFHRHDCHYQYRRQFHRPFAQAEREPGHSAGERHAFPGFPPNNSSTRM